MFKKRKKKQRPSICLPPPTPQHPFVENWISLPTSGPTAPPPPPPPPPFGRSALGESKNAPGKEREGISLMKKKI